MLTKDNGKDKQVIIKRQAVEEDKPEFGKPYEKTRKHSKFDVGENLLVIPVEIEIDSLVYSLVKHKILENMGDDIVSFEEWVNICFKEKMEQILTDAEEFDKRMLNPIRRGYCLPEVDISSNTENQK
jgi:hypothetical protein